MTTQQSASAAIKTLQALGYTHQGGEMWKPPIGDAPNFTLIDSYRSRITKLEAELVAEAARTAAEKRRADQMTLQHDMQSAMHREARHALAEETEATDNWRRLALQFDGHRMQALGYLKALLKGETDLEAGARGFIASPPIPGEQVLAERIAAMVKHATQPAPAGSLPSCPFCGESGNSAQVMDHGFWAVYCRACEGEGPPRDDSESAAEAWSRRVPTQHATLAAELATLQTKKAQQATAFDVPDQLNYWINRLTDEEGRHHLPYDAVFAAGLRPVVMRLRIGAEQHIALCKKFGPEGFHYDPSPQDILAVVSYVESQSPTAPERKPLALYQRDTIKVLAWRETRTAGYWDADAVIDGVERAHGIGASAAKCWCTTCRPRTLEDMRFVVCPDCGNKRCPRAHNHELACTNSNDPGQKGSSWEHVQPRGRDGNQS